MRRILFEKYFKVTSFVMLKFLLHSEIVVVTDGVFILEDVHTLLTLVRHFTAVCSFLQVGTGYKRSSVE